MTVIGAVGAFALAAQTLLFRDFFSAFESNELAIGAFFASWLAWVCAGALAGRFDTRVHRAIARRFPVFALLYVPAFFLQQTLLIHARGICGVEAYDVFPLLPMLAMAFLANAPVSLLTGWLFTAACRWAEERVELPVARVYVLETLGGCAGGALVTAALAVGMPGESVAVWASILLALAVALAAGRLFSARAGVAIIGAALVVTAAHGAANRLADARARAEWARLLPAEEFAGAFTTAHGRYLYGEREGQFNVVSGGGVFDSLPPGEHAAEIAALHLAHRPESRSVLVIGDGGLAVGMSLLRLPQIERVDWRHTDPEYPAKLLGLLPDGMAAQAAQVGLLTHDPVAGGDGGARYDLVILNLPDIATLALNRYVTERYFTGLRAVLNEGGAVSVRVAGGENYMGGELALTGSSMMFTLRRVFANVTIKPGDETWVMGSDEPFLYSPRGLSERFAQIPGAGQLYPPENIAALYSAGRVAFQMQAYRNQIEVSGEDVLLNTDAAPKAPTFALMLAIKQAGLPSVEGLMSTPRSRDQRAAAAMALAAGLALFGLLRTVYLLKQRRGGPDESFDSHMLVCATGTAGMAMSIVLMFAYQARFGSLFLDMGLVSALFMFGAFAGGFAAERALVAQPRNARVLACAAVFSHVCVLAALPRLTGLEARAAWALAFAGCGVFTGLHFPYAAHRLKSAGRAARTAGSNLELLDHLGGAVGSVLTGLFLLPLLGLEWTAALLALLVAVNMPGILIGGKASAANGARLFDRITRPAAYTLAGLAAFTLIASHLAAAAAKPPAYEAFREKALKLVGDRTVQDAQPPAGSEIRYFAVNGEDDADGGAYVFSTKPWAENVWAFGGTFELAVMVDELGALLGYEVVSSRETPMYVSIVRDRDSRLLGRNLFNPEPFDGVDGIAGATATDAAFRRALELAGQGFARDVLQLREAQPAHAHATGTGSRDFFVLAALMGFAVLLTYRPRLWARRAMLAASVVLLGFWLNLQYSTHQAMAVMTMQPGRFAMTGSFFLLALVPAFVLVFGNVYCGYVCPFGALQELMTDLGARLKLRRHPGRALWKYGRAVKYLVLFALVMLYGVRRDFDVLRADPLAAFFGSHADRHLAALAIAAIGVSLVFGRFWCRNLCPAGAFLALVNGARLNGSRIVRRLAPPRLPAKCDLGATSVKDLDCIYCDRCRDGRRPPPQKTQHNRIPEWAFATAVAVMLAAVAAVTFGEPASTARAHTPPVTQIQGGHGQAQDVDMQTIRRLIEQGELSDHPADFAAPAQ